MYDCTDIAEKHGISIKITPTKNNNLNLELVLNLIRSLDIVVSSDRCDFKHRKKKEHEFHKSKHYYIAIHTTECYKTHHEIFCITSAKCIWSGRASSYIQWRFRTSLYDRNNEYLVS